MSGLARVAAALALGLAACPLAPVHGQDTATDTGTAAPAERAPEAAELDAELDRLLRAAREGRPVVRPQAARQLARLGAPAAERLRAAAGTTNAELARLGRELVAVLGSLDDAELRARLWTALDDPDFPWRPDAAQSLADTAQPPEAGRFRGMLEDPLAAVRAQGVRGLGALDQRGTVPLLRRALQLDPDDRVRRLAAAQLDRWGERWALAFLLEDLRRDDRFFARETGKAARFDADLLLRERGLESDYEPRLAPDDPTNVVALEALDARLDELAGERRVAPPPTLRAAGPEVGADAVLGVEVLSCRRGEFYLRWTPDDVLWVGTGNARRVELEPGASERLLAVADAALPELGGGRLWGEPGCDVEQVYWAEPGEDGERGRPRAFRVMKGPDAVEDLRPAPLGAVARAMLASLPPSEERLRERLKAAFEAVGGPLADG